MIILLGKNGSGKTYISSKLEQMGLKRSISYTTRPKRPSEKDNIDYVFVTKEEFEKKIKNNEFIEYKKFRDNYYGTLKGNVETSDIILSGGQISSNILPYIDFVYYIESPLIMRYQSMLYRKSSSKEIFDRLHGENKDYLFDYDTKIFINNHQKTIVESVYKSIKDPNYVKEVPFKSFLEYSVESYEEVYDDRLLGFLNYEEYLLRKLYLENKLIKDEYEDDMNRFLIDNKYTFEENDEYYMINFDNDKTYCKKLVMK